MSQMATEANLTDLAAKQATSLLRYLIYVPADKVLTQAQMATELSSVNPGCVFLSCS